MKVVLFCGGMGTRLRDYSKRLPKPLVEVGARPILWHLMKYYSYYGHKEFILCLGHGAGYLKKFFLRYDQSVSSDFVLSQDRAVELLDRDIQDWKITFVDTGLHTNIGERLRCVRRYVDQDEMFLANYADALSDLPLDSYVEDFRKRGKIASFITVPAPHTFHIVHSDDEHHAVRFELITQSPVRINGGFFAFRRELFDHLHAGEELVLEPFRRLMEKRQLLAVPHDGFWQNMDTFKDKMRLDEILQRGRGPWEVWQKF
jgi:glucose-1-phosphate cytidylyltransferase